MNLSYASLWFDPKATILKLILLLKSPSGLTGNITSLTKSDSLLLAKTYWLNKLYGECFMANWVEFALHEKSILSYS